MLGLNCVAILSRGYTNEPHGNLLLDQLLGANVVVVGQAEDRPEAVLRAAHEVRGRGGVPYTIPLGGSNGIGALGYAACYLELKEQEQRRGLHFDALVTASESGGTQGGLLLGAALSGDERPIVGISAGQTRESLVALVRRVVVEGAGQLEVDLDNGFQAVTVLDDFVGDGYGIPTPEMKEALSLVARTEGILLDPVYTGKAMAGLIDLATSGAFAKHETVLFIHTGGTPGLFAYTSDLMPQGQWQNE
jgi:1-aminocyclopropane-1-carboxylate deaminase/D-cysteine desulfhydrase-like pyridoxal-dependent ACC family enzyme